MQKIIELFNGANKDKVEFNPPIKVKMPRGTKQVWIDNMYKVRDNYMLTVSTVDDAGRFSLNSVDESYLQGLLAKLTKMNEKKPVAIQS